MSNDDEAVPSPCVNVCSMHPPSGWCLGCLRTVDEIADWPELSAEAQRQILAQLPARAQRLRFTDWPETDD